MNRNKEERGIKREEEKYDAEDGEK